MKTGAYSSIERLEARVAPASVLTFTDVDGDRVKIISSAGDLNAPGVASFDFSGHQLGLLTLTDPSFQGASITTVVTKSGLGDGLVNIGRINADGRDLGSVKIKGDLGGISCGDADTNTPALKLLDVRSMGNYGTLTQGPLTNLISSLKGRLGALIVHGDIKDAEIDVIGPNGSIGAVRIGGSLIGSSIAGGGGISCSGDIGSVKIGGNLIGGDEIITGRISCGGTLRSLIIGGSLIGGGSGGTGSGAIDAGNIGAVKISRDIVGGNDIVSGIIISRRDIGSVSIGGSLVGGPGNGSGEIRADRDIGQVKIGGSIIGGVGGSSAVIIAFGELRAMKVQGDLLGGSISGTAPDLDESGYIQGERIGSIFIGGSVITGADNSASGSLTRNASIRAAHDIGSVTINGSLIGTRGTDALTEAVISAKGQVTPAKGVDLAIGKISIGGRVDNTSILAGYDTNSSPQNGNASIGAVSVRGDWLAGNLVAGVLAGPDGFGAGGVVINNGSDAIIAKIASITIGGLVVGTPGAGDHFGFTAQQIGSFKSLGFVAPLKTGPSNDKIELSPTTGDVTIFEV